MGQVAARGCHCVVTLVVKNAFNFISTATNVRNLAELVPSLVFSFRRAYYRELHFLFFGMASGEALYIASRMEAQQGNPYGAVLFCVEISPAHRNPRVRQESRATGTPGIA